MTHPALGNADLIELSNGALRLGVSTAFGPRVLLAGLDGGENLMAQLPDAKLDWRDGEQFSLRGGHRLWVAPEVRSLTYTPDDDRVTVAEIDGGTVLTTAPSASSPFRRELEIRLDSQRPTAQLIHRLIYEGESEAVAAPWAITMLPPDGVVMLPLRRGEAGQLQADRSVVLWEYTSLGDPLLEVSDDAIVVKGGRSTPTKIGTSGAAGWSAYVRGRTALIKRAMADASAPYADKGASLQCYANQHFMELETLGPLRTMAPGDTADHVEVWEFRTLDGEVSGTENLVAKLRAAVDG